MAWKRRLRRTYCHSLCPISRSVYGEQWGKSQVLVIPTHTEKIENGTLFAHMSERWWNHLLNIYSYLCLQRDILKSSEQLDRWHGSMTTRIIPSMQDPVFLKRLHTKPLPREVYPRAWPGAYLIGQLYQEFCGGWERCCSSWGTNSQVC